MSNDEALSTRETFHNPYQSCFPPRMEPEVVRQLNYAAGTSDDPRQRLRSSKAAKNSSSNKKKGTKKRKDNQKAPPTSSGQRNMHEQRQQLDNMSPNKAHEHHKSSTYPLHDNETKGFTKNHNVQSPKASDPKKDAPETSTPNNTFEKRRALSNSPPSSRKRRLESASDIEVKEETPKKKRISVTHQVGSLSSDD
ncbi:uncharacterized protein LOC142642134 [Castanea sativa]|uniref:uncharacterized protein LOC142642134 n=1 Tax=Castanea sativa TaxID=21020 RepID=UPI003F649586